MKIAERLIDDEGSKFVVQTTHDFNPAMDRAAALRSAGAGLTGESRLVGTVDLALIAEWCKEAGVSWNDIEARREVVKRKLMDGDNSHFRVWNGRF